MHLLLIICSSVLASQSFNLFLYLIQFFVYSLVFYYLSTMGHPSIFSSVFKTLRANLHTFLPILLLPLALGYAKLTFQNTKTHSHLRFLKLCLRHKVIPKGFTLYHSPSDLSNFALLANTKKVLTQASRKLMQHHIYALNQKQNSLTEQILYFKNRISLIMPPPLSSALKDTVHRHNQTIYEYCANNKRKKFSMLTNLKGTSKPIPSRCDVHPPCTTSVKANTPPSHQHKLVKCIPDSLPLTENERSVLSKGLKFVPLKSTTSKYTTLNDCERFFRKLRWMATLGKLPQAPSLGDDTDIFRYLFATPMYNEPPHNKSKELELYITKCYKEIKQLSTKPLTHSNLTPDEHTALKNLSCRQDIIIKPADKGGAVVVWDRNLYLQEAHRQLDDSLAYKALPQSTLKTHTRHISKEISEEIKLGNLPTTATLLNKSTPRQAHFYLLPKIHKPSNPGRPIVSACSCPTEHISQYLDFILQPIVQSLPTYLKDTTDTLNMLENFNHQPPFKPNLLFTLDVVSLYTSIPHADGLAALKFFLDRRPHNHKQPPTHTLVRLAELVLTLNTFEFDGTIFEQISGIAMGTKMGPSYACLFMGHFEHQILTSYSGPTPELYKRYIDDGMGATSLPPATLTDFFQFIQNFNPAIKFTFSISPTSVVFLDISIHLHNGTFFTSVHYKETDSHSYLQYKSSHPLSTKNNIPYSQFLRLRRLCSDQDDFQSKSSEMAQFFITRNYPQEVVDRALKRAESIPRSHTLLDKGIQQNERPVVSLLYHPHNLPVRRILLSNWHILESSASNTFTEKPLVAYRNDCNLRRLLVRSALRTGLHQPPGTHPCNNAKCTVCPHLCPDPTITGPKSTMSITRSFSCHSSNIVYAITCTVCSKIYIGETGRTLEIRAKEHLADIKYNRQKPVAVHFNSAGHSVKSLRIKGIWQIEGKTLDRKERESYLIKTLGTLSPAGLNEKL